MADNVITTPHDAIDLFGKGVWGPYYVNRQTATSVTVNSDGEIISIYTVDGGLTETITVLVASETRSLACWFDQETPGNSGVLINIVYLDSMGNDFSFLSVNAETGVISQSDTQIQGSLTVSTTQNLNRCCITKTRSGDLIAAYSTQSEKGCERTTDSTGATGWTIIDDVYETGTEEDYCFLYPADTGDGNDAAALFVDRSADTMSVKIYDQSGDTWTNETNIDTDVTRSFNNGITDVYFAYDGAIRHSDGHLLTALCSDPVSSGNDIRAYDITLTLTPSSAGKTDVVTNERFALIAVIVNQQNDDWFVCSVKGISFHSTGVDIVFFKSTDGGTIWGSEQAYSETTDDYRALSGGRTIGENGGFIQWLFFDDDDVDILNNLVNDVLIQAGDAPVGGVWRFNYGTSSPTLFEDGNSGFLGVSGTHQSATEADVQLKVYHQYIFKNLNVEVSTQAGGATYEFALSVGGTPSTNLVVPTVGSGFTEDITGSELVAANALVNFIVDGSAGMHGDDLAVRQAQVSYENASLLAPIFAGSDGQTIGNTSYSFPGTGAITTEAERQNKIKRSTIYKNLRVYSTSTSGTWDIAPTKDGVPSTNVTVQITGTGSVEDITGSESYVAEELFGIEWVETASGAVNPRVLQIEANTFEDWKVASGESFQTREFRGFNYLSGVGSDNLKSRIGTVLAGNLQAYFTNAGSGTRDLSLRVGAVDSTNVSLAFTTTGFIEDISGTETVLDDDGVILSMISFSSPATTAWAAVEIPHTIAVVAEQETLHRSKLIESLLTRQLVG